MPSPRPPYRHPRQPITAVAAVLVTALAAVVSLASPSTAAPPPTPAGSGPPPVPPQPDAKLITLLTGDRVQVTTAAGGRLEARFLPADPKTAGYERRTIGHDLYVVPDAAAPLIAAGRLDLALFNISGLLRQGLDDASTQDIPLISTYGGKARAGEQPMPPGALRTRTLQSVGGVALRAGKKQARTAWQALASRNHPAGRDVEKIWLDAKVRATLDESVPYVRSHKAWQAGYDGTGTTVAVLDSGIDAEHPDLAGAVQTQQNFTSSPDAADRDGHGTHTASTVLGRGTASAGRNKGVAPGARLLSGKVLDDYGLGELSWIIAGMEWAVAQGADVISMSIGTSEPADCTDPMVEALNRLSDTSDTLFVVAAGNLGGPAEKISSPGCAERALTVAAADLTGTTADFSSRGPVLAAHTVKPDITAPGVDITAARAGGRGDAAYQDMSGTSMATPHVAGAAAVLKQRHPDWDGERLKAALQSTVRAESTIGVYEQGAGMLDVADAATATVTGPGTTDLGTFAWPHTSADPVTQDLVYTNTGAQATTLRFTVDARGNNGKALPGKAFSLGAERLTVPAGGTASLPVTVVQSAALDHGLYGAISIRIVATGADGRTVVTPVGYYLEPQHVDVTFRALDRAGAPADNFYTSLDVFDMDSLAAQRHYFVGGEQTLHLRAGTYSLAAMVGSTDSAGRLESVAFLGDPEITLTENATITYDARTATRSTVQTDRATVPLGGSLTYGRVVDDWVLSNQRVFDDTVEGVYLGRTGRAKRGTFEVVEGRKLASPDTAPAPYLYSLAFTHRQQLIGPFARRVSDHQLGRIDADYHTPGEAYTYSEFTDVYRPWSLDLIETGPRVERSAPSRVEHLVTAEHDTRVSQMVSHADGMRWGFGTFMTSTPTAYRPGSRHRESWFEAGLRPGLARRSVDGSVIVPARREGNQIWCNFAGWADTQPGHYSVHGFLDLGGTELYADGAKVGEFDFYGVGFWNVPAKAADYEMVYRLFRSPLAGPFWQTPSEAETRWRFRSRAGADSDLPLLFPDYDMEVDAHDRAPRVGSYEISVGVETGPWYQPGSVNGKAWVSYDDGKTWTSAPVRPAADRQIVTVDNTGAPAGGFVSLRVELSDANGAAVTQTTTRLYGVR